jgi:hypothetical protein
MVNALEVMHVDEPPAIDANWHKTPWTGIRPQVLSNHMGPKPDHFPDTSFKIAWCEDLVFVIFRVIDRYVRAVASGYQGEVWKDSCVEFFFTPSPDVATGYFNIEMNCGGTTLFMFQNPAFFGTLEFE